ncbi:MAG: hypothetical protein EU533_08775 [Promethearchaeota archaeon]|nr:MAG: hypothetical protein EU533_08775 [Candidatus Lokiarchaeota archaeon]
MKTKLVTLFVIISMMFFSIPKVNAFEHIDNIDDGISVYFLIDLDVNDTIEISITHTGTGNFNLFLFDTRPQDSYVNLDNTLNPEIFDVAINYSLADNPYINYNVSESRIYYIQIILLENGPDTFLLYCNHDLTRYYLPIIPSYNISLILILIASISPFILVLIKKKIKKIDLY